VLYNKDFTWAKDKPVKENITHHFANNKHDLALAGDAYYLQCANAPTVDEARDELLAVLDNTVFRNDRCTMNKTGHAQQHSKYIHTSHSKYISFGLTLSRKSREQQEMRGISNRSGINIHNTQYQKLFTKLQRYTEALQPRLFGLDTKLCQYTSAIIARDALCRYHLDTTNHGNACIVAIGDFTGGDLFIDVDRSNGFITSIASTDSTHSDGCGASKTCDGTDGQAEQEKGTDAGSSLREVCK
tara:strand:+ start:365 stop:1093 length:729 start_codon:yes stop_codon:yes gene_type:complete